VGCKHVGGVAGVLRDCAHRCPRDRCDGSVAIAAYAIGDVLLLRSSLHRKPKDAKIFDGVYGGLVALAAALVLTPGTPLGLLTNAVQTLTGAPLPSAPVLLLLLCNDKAVLGPWVNPSWLNLFTGTVIAALVMLSIILTASVLYPDMNGATILTILGVGLAAVERRAKRDRLSSDSRTFGTINFVVAYDQTIHLSSKAPTKRR
jgi:hypothetical protein